MCRSSKNRLAAIGGAYTLSNKPKNGSLKSKLDHLHSFPSGDFFMWWVRKDRSVHLILKILLNSLKTTIMKKLFFLMLCTTFLAANVFAQRNSFQVKTCPDIAVTELYVQWVMIDPPPSVDYNYYNIWGAVQNIGNATMYPDASNYTAFLYAKFGNGWKLLKKFPLPKMAPGQQQNIQYSLKIKKPKKAPAVMIRVLPGIQGAKAPDCNLSNNVKYKYPQRPISPVNSFQSRKK